MAMTLHSPAFAHGGAVPAKHTADGADRSPPLFWRNVPSGARALALMVEDPDAPTPAPWVHWLLWNVPAGSFGLPEAVARRRRPLDPPGAAQGLNSFETERLGYRGPAPPPGHGTHRYVFRLYALDGPLELEAEAERPALEAAMAGHILESAELVGLYGRT